METFKIGTSVVAWRHNKSNKKNVGEFGVIADIIDTVSPIQYIVKLENRGKILSTASRLTLDN